MAEFATLVDLLRWRALEQPARQVYSFLPDGAAQGAWLDYGTLDRQARAISAALQELAPAGERALLLYPPGLEFIAALFGCLYAGLIPVPMRSPAPARPGRTLAQLQAVAAAARASLALTTAAVLNELAPRLDAWPDLPRPRWLATDALALERGVPWHAPPIGGETPALLQYTSGSTSSPRGVMLTHANLLHNLSLIQRDFGHTPESRGVIWLPHYHDMGLIGGILQPLFAGFPVVLMPPSAFIQQPYRWLKAISDYRASTSGGPSFAYDLCVERVTPAQAASLDLSCWRVAFNGAEPIRPATLEAFSARFEPYGFRRAAWYPCYGLAESTLLVTGGAPAGEPRLLNVRRSALARGRAECAAARDADTQTLVSCGRPLADLQVALVAPETGLACAADEVGEVWVAGPSVGLGYWGQPEATGRLFQARLAGNQAGPFLRTGDLGILHDGELFIVGRLKDLLIIDGVNHYPEDIEQTVAGCHPALEGCRSAAFTLSVDGQERLAVGVERRRGPAGLPDGPATIQAIEQALRRAVGEQHDLAIDAIWWLPAGGLPRTSSGKLQRFACRERYLMQLQEALSAHQQT